MLATFGMSTTDCSPVDSPRTAGVDVVINLALHDDPRYSLADERGTVEGVGMTYVHISVQFAAPQESDLLCKKRNPNATIRVGTWKLGFLWVLALWDLGFDLSTSEALPTPYPCQQDS